jgi:hypothetical protein
MTLTRANYEISVVENNTVYDFSYIVSETVDGHPTPSFVGIANFKNPGMMAGFGESDDPKPGLRIDANNTWLSTEQVDELITALVYWRETYGSL